MPKDYEEVNIMVNKSVHKALRRKAFEEDRKIKEVTNEILAEALGVKREDAPK